MDKQFLAYVKKALNAKTIRAYFNDGDVGVNSYYTIIALLQDNTVVDANLFGGDWNYDQYTDTSDSFSVVYSKLAFVPSHPDEKRRFLDFIIENHADSDLIELCKTLKQSSE